MGAQGTTPPYHIARLGALRALGAAAIDYVDQPDEWDAAFFNQYLSVAQQSDEGLAEVSKMRLSVDAELVQGADSEELEATIDGLGPDQIRALEGGLKALLRPGALVRSVSTTDEPKKPNPSNPWRRKHVWAGPGTQRRLTGDTVVHGGAGPAHA